MAFDVRRCRACGSASPCVMVGLLLLRLVVRGPLDRLARRADAARAGLVQVALALAGAVVQVFPIPLPIRFFRHGGLLAFFAHHRPPFSGCKTRSGGGARSYARSGLMSTTGVPSIASI